MHLQKNHFHKPVPALVRAQMHRTRGFPQAAYLNLLKPKFESFASSGPVAHLVGRAAPLRAGTGRDETRLKAKLESDAVPESRISSTKPLRLRLSAVKTEAVEGIDSHVVKSVVQTDLHTATGPDRAALYHADFTALQSGALRHNRNSERCQSRRQKAAPYIFPWRVCFAKKRSKSGRAGSPLPPHLLVWT